MATETLAPPRATVRQLPPEEWEAKLAGLPTGEHYGLPDPQFAQILVAEDPGTGAVVGVWCALTTVHLEGLWIAPSHRKTSVAAQLLRGMKALLRQLGIVHSFTMVDVSNPEVLILALKAGFTKLPVDLLFLDLTGDASCQPQSPS